MLLTTENMAVLALMPSANVEMATTVKLGLRVSKLTACRISCNSVSMSISSYM